MKYLNQNPIIYLLAIVLTVFAFVLSQNKPPLGGSVDSVSLAEIENEKISDYSNLEKAPVYDGKTLPEDYIIASVVSGKIPNFTQENLVLDDYIPFYVEALEKLGIDQIEIIKKLGKGKTVNLATEIRKAEKMNGKIVKRLATTTTTVIVEDVL